VNEEGKGKVAFPLMLIYETTTGSSVFTAHGVTNRQSHRHAHADHATSRQIAKITRIPCFARKAGRSKPVNGRIAQFRAESFDAGLAVSVC